MKALCRVFVQCDCSLAEINPLVVTGDGDLVALDAKMTFDDNALFRHPDDRRVARPGRRGAGRGAGRRRRD